MLVVNAVAVHNFILYNPKRLCFINLFKAAFHSVSRVCVQSEKKPYKIIELAIMHEWQFWEETFHQTTSNQKQQQQQQQQHLLTATCANENVQGNNK
ncbi:hypothetical protein T10_6061 [Trichinella papuae]|uniref:Uncharacterized protein n=1 Tax=Trichinella papuae TaxID=268474 RepID=A0A0V1M629_9BILA|nr:hypothetical protein T10_6061 [Trichinella papuae]